MVKGMFFISMVVSIAGLMAVESPKDLNDISCVYWDDPGDDPRISVDFRYHDKTNDFVHVTINKRMTDSDESWEVISETDEQLMVNDRVFSFGVDDIVITIQRPVPGWNKAKKPNGTLLFRNNGESYPLICENIKK